MLIDGKWVENWQPVQASDSEGRFLRQRSGFRERIAPQDAVAGRYRLYIAWICPWASRTFIALQLKGLQEVIDVRVVDPRLTSQGWCFSGELGSDHCELTEADYLHRLYSASDAHYNGRATVPVLWDKQQGRIVNNESADILQIFEHDFGELADASVQLRPAALANEIDGFASWLYDNFNNGVYQAGFAGSQGAYEEAVAKVFTSLDALEQRLQHSQWLVGEQLTECDIRAFVTLVRFELAYYGLFKCNLRPLSDYPAVLGYLKRLLAIPAFAASVNPQHIKAGYYSIRTLNPSGIVPVGPTPDYLAEFL